MNVFVDECVNKKIMPHLKGHYFVHATDTALRSTKNGALLRAVATDYDVFMTTDRNIPFQQNLQLIPLAFVILRSASSRIEDLILLVAKTLAVLDSIEQAPLVAGDVYEVKL